MKIYTGSGDQGKTSLLSGERVPKSEDRVEAYGDVDELNSVLGMLSGSLPREETLLIEEIGQIQGVLLHLGAWLATERESPSLRMIRGISEDEIKWLETAIDRLSDQLPALGHFIIPGGHFNAGLAHVARTVCRRAERHVVALSLNVRLNKPPLVLKGAIAFLNRLSDYLFVVARYCNWSRGVPEQVWLK